MTDKAKETAQPEDATDKQLEKAAGGQDGRYRDERGGYREGMWEGHHYHEGYRGSYDAGGIFIRL